MPFIIRCFLPVISAVSILHQANAANKPLQVFILAGQSNMEGHAQTSTFPAVAKEPKTKDLHDKMVGADGEPVVCEDVWMSYAYGNFSGDPVGRKTGNLTAGWGSQHHVGTGKIGPELTFGITMQEHLGEPILIIKNAWGGKSLMVDFRPPSAGDLPDAKPEQREKTGRYYQLTVEHVKDVLADIAAVYPDYDASAGYELAGFVWFQGFNDLVGRYPQGEANQDGKRTKDYSEYSRLLACLIRDVRNDLQAPEMPFVVGVLGVGGPEADPNTVAFRQAMAAPAAMDEFQGNVVNVFSENYWPTEIDAVMAKVEPLKQERKRKDNELKKLELSDEELRKRQAALTEELNQAIDKALSDEEQFTLEVGISNRGFHYYGSAKFFALLGQAFAEALIELKRN